MHNWYSTHSIHLYSRWNVLVTLGATLEQGKNQTPFLWWEHLWLLPFFISFLLSCYRSFPHFSHHFEVPLPLQLSRMQRRKRRCLNQRCAPRGSRKATRELASCRSCRGCGNGTACVAVIGWGRQGLFLARWSDHSYTWNHLNTHFHGPFHFISLQHFSQVFLMQRGISDLTLRGLACTEASMLQEQWTYKIISRWKLWCAERRMLIVPCPRCPCPLLYGCSEILKAVRHCEALAQPGEARRWAEKVGQRACYRVWCGEVQDYIWFQIPDRHR